MHVGDSYFEVLDNGRGIEDEDRPVIWALGGRIDSEGSGVGLALSRIIVENHGGEITLNSEVGTGSTFVVRLPL